MLIFANTSLNTTQQMVYKNFSAYNYSEVTQIIKFIPQESSFDSAVKIIPDGLVSLSKEERHSYEASVDKLYKPTGIKFF